MKPLKLTVTAVGPFATRQEIDFGALSQCNLFLIEGPTGIGKTSILDAICTALYGQSSGGDRLHHSMRSHWVDPSVKPEISFDFEFQTKTYRVTRTLEHQRERRRQGGDGKMVGVKADASLDEVKANGTTSPLATG